MKLLLLSLFLTGWLAQGQSPGMIFGRVSAANGAPLAGVSLQLRAVSGVLLDTASSDRTGHFELNSHGQVGQTVEAIWGEQDQLVEIANPPQSVEIVFHDLPPSASSFMIGLDDLKAPTKARNDLDAANRDMARGSMNRAFREADRAVHEDPGWAQAYLVRGVLRLEQKDLPGARADLDRSVTINPENGMALTELGKVYSAMGQPKQALIYLHQAVAHPPVQWPAYFELAAADLKLGNFAEAAVMARRSGSATPPGPPTWLMIAAVSEIHLQEWPQARQDLTDFIQAAQTDPSQQHSIGQAKMLLSQLPAR